MTLVSTAGIAQDLGVATRTVYGWRERYPDFPAPINETPLGRLYDLDQIRAWYREADRSPGRRRR